MTWPHRNSGPPVLKRIKAHLNIGSIGGKSLLGNISQVYGVEVRRCGYTQHVTVPVSARDQSLRLFTFDPTHLISMQSASPYFYVTSLLNTPAAINMHHPLVHADFSRTHSRDIPRSRERCCSCASTIPESQ
jgi:hypothetical protein